MATAPVEALALVPVERIIAPVVPVGATPAFAETRCKEPVVVCELSPERREIVPPVLASEPRSAVYPATIVMPPPLPLFPSPTANVISPPRPELDVPVESRTEPDVTPVAPLSPPDCPVEIMMLPLTPAVAEFVVDIFMLPLEAAELKPLERCRSPPDIASLRPAAM